MGEYQTSLSEKRGELKQALARLKEEFGVDSLAAAQDKLRELEEELQGITDELEDAYSRLKEKYKW